VSLQRELFLGFVKTHILYHAAKGEVYGLWLIEELSRHGYRLSPGTLYPMLANLVRDGLLTVEKRTTGGRVRKYYEATPLGLETLSAAREKAVELVRELDEVTGEP
jgi:DNA-binding PadR family transcriptional regulator